MVARPDRALSDAFRWKDVVEVVRAHVLFVQEADNHIQKEGQAEAQEKGGGQGNEAADPGDLEPEVSREPSDGQPASAEPPGDRPKDRQPEPDEEKGPPDGGQIRHYKSGRRGWGAVDGSSPRC